MKLKLFKTLWGFTGASIDEAIDELLAAGMHGLEGPAPIEPDEQVRMAELLQKHKLDYIAEITTAGSYVPERSATLQEHLDSLEEKLQHSVPLKPLFVSCLGGCDAWPESMSIEFFKQATALAKKYKLDISFETHRSRSMFNPWVTQRMVEQIPEIKLTVDFSHWCVVCERLMDTELDVIHAIANNVQHIHARIGYEQGPQVPEPRAPEYEYALRAHQSWWEIIWQAQLNQNINVTSITPEFGPDGYLQEQPYTRKPVANLWELNIWMAQEELRHFKIFMDN